MKVFLRLALPMLLVSILNIDIKAQNTDYDNYIDVEIRDTHILYVQIIQSEIKGDIIESGSISYLESSGNIYVVAQSIIKTSKDFNSLRSEVEKAMSSLKESEFIGVNRSKQWESVPKSTHFRTSWTLTDLQSNDSLELIFIYSSTENELWIRSIPHKSIPAN